MKKNVLKLMALTFAVSLTLSFAGCGDKNAENVDSDKESSETTTEVSEADESGESDESETEESAGAETSEASTEESESNESESSGLTRLEEWLAEPEQQEFVASLSSDSEELSSELFVENGNILVFRSTYKEQVKDSDMGMEDIEELSTLLEEEGSEAVMFLVDTLRTELEMDDIMFRLEICNADGSVIITKDFE